MTKEETEALARAFASRIQECPAIADWQRLHLALFGVPLTIGVGAPEENQDDIDS